MVLATVGSGVYKFFLLLHILSAIIGFGGVMLNGAYAARARQQSDREALAIQQANSWVTLNIAMYFIYAVFVFGLITAIIGKPAVKFSQGWLSAAMALYIVGIAISHAVMIPTSKKLGRALSGLANGPQPGGAGDGRQAQVAEVDALSRRLGIFGAILNLLIIVILFLMVVKPGLNTAL
jgi:uncharacterized membrane protein